MVKLKILALVVLVGMGFASFNYSSPEPKIGLEIGDKVPQFQTTLINGEDFDLHYLKGKMILIDFWASYDGASRIENHQKMALQQKFANSKFYRGEGFVIVSVSLDQFKSPLLKAIKEDAYIKALHICDLKGAESPLAQTYQITSPSNILIDGEGRLISMSESITDIESSLEYLYSYAN